MGTMPQGYEIPTPGAVLQFTSSRSTRGCVRAKKPARYSRRSSKNRVYAFPRSCGFSTKFFFKWRREEKGKSKGITKGEALIMID